jgi:hypothetical protein
MKKGNVFNDMIADFKNGTYNFTCDGKCSCCGDCCSNFLPISRKEIKEIKRYIVKHNIKRVNHKPAVATNFLDMTCPFLDPDGGNEKCRIYPVRPYVCREFICDPAQRKPLSVDYQKVRPQLMTEIFFGDFETSEKLAEILAEAVGR